MTDHVKKMIATAQLVAHDHALVQEVASRVLDTLRSDGYEDEILVLMSAAPEDMPIGNIHMAVHPAVLLEVKRRLNEMGAYNHDK